LKKFKTGIFYLTVLLLPILFSCSTERELAKEFVKSNKDIPVLLEITDKIILTNEKLKKIKDFDLMSVDKQDSLWNYQTLYLDSINDKKIIDLTFNNMKTSLQNLGFQVYTIDSINSFRELEKFKYTFKIAQLEVSEDMYIYRDEETFFNNLTYYQDNNLNIININYWFEFKDINNKIEKVFFNSAAISDILKGKFEMNPTDYSVSYKYNIKPLIIDDIYKLTTETAYKNASLFYDYLMNQYIKDNISKNYLNPKYFSLDPKTGYIFNSDSEKFTIIEPE